MPVVITPPEPAPAPSPPSGAASGRPVTPKLQVPVRFDGRSFAVVEQHSDDEIAACVYAVVATPRGSRLEEPDFGVEDAEFDELPLDTDEWVEQVGIWEPRAEVSTSEEIEEMVDNVTVRTKAR